MVLEKINIKDLIRSGQKELFVNESYYYDDLPIKGAVDTQASVRANVSGLTVRGRFFANVEEPCDRCYEPFEREIKDIFEEQFVFESFTDENPSGEKELKSEDFYETIRPDGELDLKDLIRQLIVMNLSINRICERETCSAT